MHLKQLSLSILHVKSNKLKDIVKELERAISGYDYESEASSGSKIRI